MVEIYNTRIDEVKVLYPKVFEDNRGSFMELYNYRALMENGIVHKFVQDNLSTSKQWVLRGVHTQIKHPQAKLITCLHGAIFDVAVDCRTTSPTFGKWYGETLSADNHKQIYLPAGVAHGYFALEDSTVYMKVDTHYTPGDEIGFRWDDVEVGVKWPIPEGINPIFADKDIHWKCFREMIADLTTLRNNQE